MSEVDIERNGDAGASVNGTRNRGGGVEIYVLVTTHCDTCRARIQQRHYQHIPFIRWHMCCDCASREWARRMRLPAHH